MQPSIYLAACLTLFTPTAALAWGASGHSIVAEIAQRHLTAAASEKLRAILGGDISLASIGSWADDYKFTPAGLKTKPWHFVDIDITKDTYSPVSDCPDDACLPQALKEQVAVLSNAQLAPEIRRTALYFVVHLTGDLTQPFHCSERGGDAGGNAIKADFEANGPDGKKRPIPQTNMHAIWDEALIDSHAWSWGAYADELEATVAPTMPKVVYEDHAIEDWVNQCHAVGQGMYKSIPQPDANGIVVIGLDYQKAVQTVLDQQLTRGGLELAAILNDALTRN